MGEVRRALLIGVAHAPEAVVEFAPLDETVAADLTAMRDALEESGYDVQTVAGDSRAAIEIQIYEAARGMPEGGTLVLYFTGHGVRIDDVDYLVPADARAPRDGDWRPPYVHSLLPADIGEALRECRAGTVLWLIDACRDGLGGKDAFGSRIRGGPPGGRFAMMVGCSPGERSGCSPEGSLFTRGLAEALGAMSAPRTVHEVFEAARTRTAELARRHGLVQRPQIRYGTDHEEQTRQTEVCQGRHLLEEWREAVRDQAMWLPAAGGDERLIARLQECLLSLVEECARAVHRAQRRLPDPWADDDFPVRLLQLGLARLLPPDAELSPLEVAALIAAPFLHEAAWADRLAQAAEADPLRESRIPGAGAHRRHLEQVFDHHAHITRKLATCRRQGRTEDERAVALWLVHRWISERFETDEEAVPAALAERFARDVLGARAGDDGRVDELSQALRRLAAGVGVDAPPDDTPAGPCPSMVRLPDGRQLFRARPLGALLRLAAALAADVRTFPAVIAEHLAVSDPVRPADVVRVVRRPSLDWLPDEGGRGELHMDVRCPHQALHSALTELAERADALAEATRKSAARIPEKEAALLAAVPTRITSRELRPGAAAGRPAYEVPLLRFHLAQTEVRSLLMGQQLYGDPALAIRELYQNAMDACRYRDMRWRYLRRKGQRPAAWSGRITVVQGEDSRGRYVECRDNGVGMGLEQLQNTFIRAGSRFEQSRTFRREQANWLRLDPSLRLYPNSRFGIGVLSYFMLADEMTLVTRQVSPEGIPAEHALRVDIPSSGSLFRVQRQLDDGEDGRPEGGTRVRLYLRDDDELAGLSCVSTLLRLVRVSEVRLEASDAPGRSTVWEPGALRHGPSAREAVPGVLWWVKGAGALLCDGITTDRSPFGYVLNLTGAHAGRLSVDRNKLLSYDGTWARRTWREGADAIPEWPELTMEWLWQLESQSRPVARAVWQALRGKGVKAPLTGRPPGGGEVRDLDTLGWFHPDAVVLGGELRPDYDLLGRVRPWRSAALDRRHAEGGQAAPLSLAGHPVPDAGDAAICTNAQRDWRKVISQAATDRVPVGEVLRVLRRMRVVHPELAPPPMSAPDPGWIPTAAEKSITDALSGAVGKRERLKLDGPLDLAGLVWASRDLRLPLGELIRRCARFAPLRGAPFPEVPPHHEDHVCTDADLALLFMQEEKHQYSTMMWRVREPWEVCEIAQQTYTEPAEVLERLSAFGWLGWSTPAAEAVGAWTALDDVLRLLVRRYCHKEPDGRWVLRWAATVELAAEWDVSPAGAQEDLADLAPRLGLEYLRLDGVAPDDELVPYAAAELVPHIDDTGGRLERGLTLEELALCRPYQMGMDAFAECVDELREIGVELPTDISLIEHWAELSVPTRFALSGKDVTFDEADYPATRPSGDVLFSAGVRLEVPLAAVWELAGEQAKRFGLTLPRLPGELAALRPTWRESQALLDHSGSGSDEDFPAPVWKPLTCLELARYARAIGTDAATAYQRLAPLRAIGALVPELACETVEGLRSAEPDGRDLIALDDGHRVSAPDEPLVPLDLVSIAGRLGEEVAQTWRRLAPYRPLLPETDIPDPPEVLPLWQDLVILSVRLDGMLPALSGRVEPAQVALAAHATGESESWVRGRLAQYAGLFALDLSGLPGEPTDAEGADAEGADA